MASTSASAGGREINVHTAEAEACVVSGPLRAVRDQTEGEQTYLRVDSEVPHDGCPPRIECRVGAKHDGLYEVKILIRTPNRELNPFAVQLGGRKVSWNLRRASRWSYRNAPELFDLKRGDHTLSVLPRCEGVEIDAVRVVRDPVFQTIRTNPAPPFEMPAFEAPQFPDREFNIAAQGAVADGKTKNTEPFRRAIEACANVGGGRVVVGPGRWLTGPIHLKSNVNLHLEQGAVVLFSTDVEDYLPPVFVRWAGFECYNYSPLIYARDCQNIALTGPGKLDGQGLAWWHMRDRQQDTAKRLHRQALLETPPEERVYGSTQAGLRPQFFAPVNCRGVLLEDVSFYSGPFWTVHFTYCENVMARRVKCFTNGPNNDGINCDSSRNVIVEHCYFDTSDDAVAVKSGLNEDGWRVGRPSENIIIRHCRSSGGRWGGVSVGSDMSGGVSNVFVHDVHFSDTNRAINFKSTRGRGGAVENVLVQDILVDRCGNEAVRLDTQYRAWFGSDTGVAPLFRNVVIRDLVARDVLSAMCIRGLPEQPIENLVLENIFASGAREATQIGGVADLQMHNVSVRSTPP
jgi:hypothetical protein